MATKISVRQMQIGSKDVYVIRREPSSHVVSTETIDYLRSHGANDRTLKTASKVLKQGGSKAVR